VVVVTVVALALSAATLLGDSAGAAAGNDDEKVVVKPPEGTGTPPAGTGLGTRAALDDARCNTDERYSTYGRWPEASIGAGPACVRPFADGEDNGGATSRGVTADAITVVVVLPSDERAKAQEATAPPRRRGDQSIGSWADMTHDYLAAYLPFYETWGRDLDVILYQSTGIDETAQRADATAILAEKPFAVINFDTYGLDTLVTTIAQAKTLVHSYAASPKETIAQAPYRWGGNDPDAAAVNAAELLGKQFSGNKAEYAGEALQSTTRKLGVVMIEDVIDQSLFEEVLADNGGKKPAVYSTYVGSGGALGDAATAQQEAPVMVQRMKDAGVTTVVLFTDRAMNAALMEQATAQDWFPEWFMTGSGYYDLAALAVGLPEEQSEHAFGISIFGPYFAFPPEIDKIIGADGAYNWFWGEANGTSSGVAGSGVVWLMNGLHHAGPGLTPKTFRQGLFAMPAEGGAKNDNPLVGLTGYGKTTGLPYDAYIPGPADFAPFWMDPHQKAISPGVEREVDHASWYIDGGKRYGIGDWPKKLPYFDKTKAVYELSEYPASLPPPTAAPACAAGQCPSSGSTAIAPGAPGDRFTLDASLGSPAASS
jgi:hypothetical protein